METTEDKLLGGRVKILQPKKGYRVAIDPLLLAAVIPAKAGDKVLDLGSGTGAVSFCLHARIPECEITGIEINPVYHQLSIQSADLNGWGHNPRFILGDISKDHPELLEGFFDWVAANPPYYGEKSYSHSPDAGKSSAHASDLDLEVWIKSAARFLKPNGGFAMIYPAEDGDATLAKLAPHFREIRIIRVHGYAGKDAKRLIILAKKTGFPSFSEVGSLVLHDDAGKFTPTAREILWEGAEIRVVM